MKITIIYDNTAYREDLKADWGFAALVETLDNTILFDTGTNGTILLSNMEKLGISPDEVQDIFISHDHFDHTGGLSAFLNEHNNVEIFIPPSFREYTKAIKTTSIKTPGEISRGIYSTGELEGIEQSLCVQTQEGIVVVVGCSHPDMSEILRAASRFGRVYGIIGGMHANKPESLKGPDLICPTHCTQHIKEMKALYPDQYIEGGAGQVIEIE